MLYYSSQYKPAQTELYRSLILLVGWSMFAFVAYKVAISKHDNKVYNPFEILDIAMVCFTLFHKLLTSHRCNRVHQ